MDINDIRSLVTLLSLLLFLGLMLWTWWPSRRATHEAAARLPFLDDGGSAGDTRREGGRP